MSLAAYNNNSNNNHSRPSVDSIYDLLKGLDDNQAEDLLRDLNHTTPSNVPVTEGIDFFEGPAENNASSSTRSTRRRTTFLKAASTFDLRSSSERAGRLGGGPSPSSPSPSSPSLPSPSSGDDHHDQQQKQPVAPPLPPPSSPPRARSASAVHREADEEAQRRKDDRFKTPRAYKRISRPWATLAPPSSPGGGPDVVRDLLMAYLSGSTPSSFSSSAAAASSPSSLYSSSSSSVSADSPATPRSIAASTFFSPIVFSPMEPEVDSPGLADLLEPSPSRTKPRFAAVAPGGSSSTSGRPAPASLYSGDNISGIFEVLSGGS